MSTVKTRSAQAERRLSLPEILAALLADGLVKAEDAAELSRERRFYGGDIHPLAMVAEQKWKSAQPPHKMLTLDVLAEWLARFSGLEYVHIDPLRIDFSTVTDVVSNAYAARFKILPIQVTSKEVVIATAEPFVREWEGELKQILRKDIKRVISNPADINRYLVEFHNLARSVKKALQSGDTGGGVSSFEQLVELGKANR